MRQPDSDGYRMALSGRVFCRVLAGLLMSAFLFCGDLAWAEHKGASREGQTAPHHAASKRGSNPATSAGRHRHTAPHHAASKRSSHSTKAASRHRPSTRHHATVAHNRKSAGHHVTRGRTVARATHGHPHQRHAARTKHHRRTVARNLPVIVIDPGHGGKDSGAIGRSGTLEKNVTLATAIELRRLLQATGRYRVVMTRTNDRFVSLAARVAFAKAHHGSLFIAIHANSSRNSRAHGASVYVRSGQGSGDDVKHLAADSGSSARIADALAGPKPPPRPGSAWLQYTMIDNLDDDIRMAKKPAREAHFYVLGARGVPSVLLEIGFLSNRHDETELNKARYRRVIAQAIRDAIGDYFDELAHPDAQRT